mgnify:CR=1 FL=1
MSIDFDRIAEIEKRLNVQGRIDWAPHGPQGQLLIRYPQNPNRDQATFIAKAPMDIAFLLDVIEQLAGGESETHEPNRSSGPDAEAGAGHDTGAGAGDVQDPGPASEPAKKTQGRNKRG